MNTGGVCSLFHRRFCLFANVTLHRIAKYAIQVGTLAKNLQEGTYSAHIYIISPHTKHLLALFQGYIEFLKCPIPRQLLAFSSYVNHGGVYREILSPHTPLLYNCGVESAYFSLYTPVLIKDIYFYLIFATFYGSAGYFGITLCYIPHQHIPIN